MWKSWGARGRYSRGFLLASSHKIFAVVATTPEVNQCLPDMIVRQGSPGSASSSLSRNRGRPFCAASGYFASTLYIASIALFRICGRECVSIAMISGLRSRERSGVTICDKPLRVMATSAGVEARSCVALNTDAQETCGSRTFLMVFVVSISTSVS